MHSSRLRIAACLSVTLGACGDSGGGERVPPIDPCANPGVPFAVGSDQGHPDPLGSAPGQARAGRIEAAELPPSPDGLATWEPGDFVLANDRVAMVIEDDGDSDLYDPWGGKPVGLAHVSGGQLVDPSDFGEMLIFAFGPSTVVTENVGVVADGSDGGAALVRAEGRIHPIPFVYGLIGVYWLGETYRDLSTRFAIDYVLEPNSEHVDVYVRARHADPVNPLWPGEVEGHGFMFTDRLKAFQPNGNGFDPELTRESSHEWLAFVDDRGVGYGFEAPGEILEPLPSASGFVGARSPSHAFPNCTEAENDAYLSSRIHIGGPDADALLDVVARSRGTASRTITGTVAAAGGGGRAGVRVHAVRADDHTRYLTRTRTDATGAFVLHVPVGVAVDLYAFVPGEQLVGPDNVGPAETTASLSLSEVATVHVEAAVDDQGDPIPYKLQVLPAGGGTTIPAPLFVNWGEDMPTSGRLHEEFVLAGDSRDLTLPPGTWKIVASRGFRYEYAETTVTVVGGDTETFSPALTRSVDTPGVYCADFHIHTRRSNDSADDPVMKLRAGLAEDLDLPVRSEHEYVEDWDQIVTAPRAQGGLDSGAFMVAPTSVELSTMELYGHFGVVPVFEDPALPNGGTPLWQEFPNASDYDRPLRNLTPSELFASVHARAEDPIIIVNHPRGGRNYFGYTGYDGTTGTVGRPDRWSEDFEGIEVFNDANWVNSRNGTVRDWLSFLDRGVHVVAVGSSDTHSVAGSPMGYPRTCMDFNPVGITSLPQLAADRRAFNYELRDALAEERATVNGGIFVDASVGQAGPGETATGLGTMTDVRIVVRAALWMDVDTVEVIVDGQTYATLDVANDCTQNGVVRCDILQSIPVGVANSYVVVAAYGDAPMEPVMRNRIPFGATNAVYLER